MYCLQHCMLDHAQNSNFKDVIKKIFSMSSIAHAPVLMAPFSSCSRTCKIDKDDLKTKMDSPGQQAGLLEVFRRISSPATLARLLELCEADTPSDQRTSTSEPTPGETPAGGGPVDSVSLDLRESGPADNGGAVAQQSSPSQSVESVSDDRTTAFAAVRSPCQGLGLVELLDNTHIPHSTTLPGVPASGGHTHFDDRGVSATERLGSESAGAFSRVPGLTPQCTGVPASGVHVNPALDFDELGVPALYRPGESPLESDTLGSTSKRPRMAEDDDYDPCRQEATFEADERITTYLERQVTRTLSTAERERAQKECPRPDHPAAKTPSIDPFLWEVLDLDRSRLRREDELLYHVHAAILDITGPLCGLWQDMVETADTQQTPIAQLNLGGAEVLEVVQRSLALMGAAAAMVWRARRQSVLRHLGHWATPISKDLPTTTTGLMFGDVLRERLQTRSQLSRLAAEVRRRPSGGHRATSSTQRGQRRRFLARGKPAQYGSSLPDRRQEPYKPVYSQRRGNSRFHSTSGRGRGRPAPSSR